MSKNKNNNKKYFLTFASSDLNRTLRRITKQAINLKIYDKIYSYNEENLSYEFTKIFKNKLILRSKGFGYWSWKPQILLQILEKINEGDIVQYTDAGCHLNINGIQRLHEYFEIAKNANNGILAFQAKEPEEHLKVNDRNFPSLPDSEWVKGDLLDYLNIRERYDLLNSPTIGAGIIFIRKCPQSVKIIQDWLDIIKFDFKLLDDSPSRNTNLINFKGHRHDQSIFSLLCKINDVATISSYEYWYPSADGINPDWIILNKYPIHAKRDKDSGFIFRLLSLINRKIFKYLNIKLFI